MAASRWTYASHWLSASALRFSTICGTGNHILTCCRMHSRCFDLYPTSFAPTRRSQLNGLWTMSRDRQAIPLRLARRYSIALSSPFLRDVWPQERAAVTPAVSKAFASVPAASGRRFPRAVSSLRRFLVPFKSWSVHDWGFLGDGGSGLRGGVILGKEEATAALDLLDLTISKGSDVHVPRGLDTALAVLLSENTALRRDLRFARLAALARP